ncbi:hypothetical protein HMPREF9997_01141 [Corynebacterium durum F0235]|uniref:Uncharacterized protein n=1 Tax=Corynebacterium durum F0235 TaxID=1035195 RepID=L1MHV4_9CORY|nr:hypothetical protein HMPREF9997_01141 [Corynebacterium durum F0235]
MSVPFLTMQPLPCFKEKLAFFFDVWNKQGSDGVEALSVH